MIDVTCAIIELDGRVLVAQRSEKMDLPHKWEFPGGKINNNESAEDCIIREIKEELCIDISVIRQLSPSIFDYGIKKIRLIPFVCVVVGGKLESLEHQTTAWLEKNQIEELDWCAADVPVMIEYLRGQPHG